jgi:hypothetical protein
LPYYGLPVRLVYKARINPVWGKVKKNEESLGNLELKPWRTARLYREYHKDPVRL